MIADTAKPARSRFASRQNERFGLRSHGLKSFGSGIKNNISIGSPETPVGRNDPNQFSQLLPRCRHVSGDRNSLSFGYSADPGAKSDFS
ncbi:hypothetical protein, partial [Victivallis vadensis]|uniref:hypothetical protein n=1 Tax=Victivallis vadensis TaxID=172901 RepID=UPI00266D9650